jgi:hypothetical protein
MLNLLNFEKRVKFAAVLILPNRFIAVAAAALPLLPLAQKPGICHRHIV